MSFSYICVFSCLFVNFVCLLFFCIALASAFSCRSSDGISREVLHAKKDSIKVNKKQKKKQDPIINKDDYYNPNFLRYENYVYDVNIKTVSLEISELNQLIHRFLP